VKRALVVSFACVATVFACGDSVESRSALEEPVRVTYFVGSTSFQAQFFAGELPAAADGPPVIGIDIGPLQAAPGKIGKGGYTVRLENDAYAVAVRVAGRNNGYWIARVDQVEPLFGGQVSASLAFDISPDVAPQMMQLEFSGVSKNQHFGPRMAAPLSIVPRYPTNAPAVIQLRWDAPVDLDLQLRSPDGTFLDPKRPTTAPVGTPDAGTAPGYGQLQGDSMASCVNDGQREELVVFSTPPLAGKYQIYVNPFDLCRKLGTAYEVSVIKSGTVEQRFYGRISEAEVERGGFALGDFVSDITF
jgi:hypothetical protein